MEYWDLYDKHFQKIGKTHLRGEKMPQGTYHLVVHVCIFNQKDEMLIQQRQPFKEGWPNLWDVTMGGSALKGETSQQAATREVKEELGLDIDLTNCRPSLTNHFEQGFDDIYLIHQEVDLSKLQLQYEEVQDVKWASQQEILELIREGQFIPYYESLINLFFEMRHSVGMIRESI
ncbi:MAG: NUDIX domain-containing protein [Coprobacillus cateniformis]|uniref:NUDIX hydrolase n=1 Tax=Longibaculum muris TaxID=1796628 RepID=UPI003AB69D74|nr:NUDIX domain-containing protein [Coprobacillus cateniformis]